MELQTLASSFTDCIKRYSHWQRGLSVRWPFIYAEDVIIITALYSARPDSRSMALGIGLAGLALALLIWLQAYGKSSSELLIVGPYRFLQQPQQLAFWLSALALGLGARSFPGLLLGLGLMPWLYWSDQLSSETYQHSKNLRGTRYRRFVPAFIPNFFPYRSEDPGTQVKFSWRKALFGIEQEPRQRWLRLLLAWLMLGLVWADLFPRIQLWMAASTWILIIILRVAKRATKSNLAVLQKQLSNKKP